MKVQVRNGMNGHHTESSRPGTITKLKWLVQVLLATVVASATWPAASAAAAPVRSRGDDHGSITLYSGNGRNNRSYSAINSPTNTHGVQQMVNSSVSSTNTMQASICKKRQRICKIRHRLHISGRGE
ncbi:hypothetical protein [Sphaerisporangium album]|uniref:hypothetical protein n=1 Tax=Sphaerisporangium album TaxID=509200 RepID=UPI0011C066A4|nr:hypothetical protein [Sphaerisporangium album]